MPKPTPCRRCRSALASTLLSTLLATLLAAPAQAGIEPTPFIDWSMAQQLHGSGPLGDDPRVIVGFNPQPEPPRVFDSFLDLSTPSQPTLVRRGDFAPGTAFDLVLAIGGSGDGLTLLPKFDGGIPTGGVATLGFDVIGPGGHDLFDVFVDFGSSSGGVLDGFSAVAFNPQPEPPAARFGADSDFGVSFTFTSFSDTWVRLRVFDLQGNALQFSAVPAPATLALAGLALAGLGLRRRHG